MALTSPEASATTGSQPARRVRARRKGGFEPRWVRLRGGLGASHVLPARVADAARAGFGRSFVAVSGLPRRVTGTTRHEAGRKLRGLPHSGQHGARRDPDAREGSTGTRRSESPSSTRGKLLETGRTRRRGPSRMRRQPCGARAPSVGEPVPDPARPGCVFDGGTADHPRAELRPRFPRYEPL